MTASKRERGTHFYRRGRPKGPRTYPRIALVTAFHGRPKLTRKFMEYYGGSTGWYDRSDAQGNWTLGPLIGVGDLGVEGVNGGHPRAMWQFFEHENITSDRFNRGCEIALEDRTVDGVLIVGSDDFMSPALLDAMVREFCRGYDFVGLDGVYWYELESGLCRYTPMVGVDGHPGCLGAGRLLSRELLEQLGGRPYRPGLTSKIDTSMCDRMRGLDEWASGTVVHVDDVKCIVDVKSAEGNIWPFTKWATTYGRWCDPWFVGQFGLEEPKVMA